MSSRPAWTIQQVPSQPELHSKTVSKGVGGGLGIEMAQLVKALATKPDTLSPMPRIYVVEGENRLLQVVL